MAIPAAYLWLLMFYSLFHGYLNLLAELTQFSDRRFYSDWWNAGDLAEYWKKWNQPIHNFIHRHIYYPMRRRGFSAVQCIYISFTVSAVFHELLVFGVFGVVNFISFIVMFVNAPAMIMQGGLLHKGLISKNTNNIAFWLFYIMLAQPFGILFCYY